MSQRPVFVNKVLFERGPGWGCGERGRVMWVQGGIQSFYTCLVFCSWMFLLHSFKNHCIRKFLLWSLSVWATPLNFVPEVRASLAPPPRPGPDKNPQKLDPNLRKRISQVPVNPLSASPDCFSLPLPALPHPRDDACCLDRLLLGTCFIMPDFPLWGTSFTLVHKHLSFSLARFWTS